MFEKKTTLTLFALLFLTFLFLTISYAQITNLESIKVLSFNIRYDNPNDGINQWSNRKVLAARTIQKHEVDIIGMQEVLKNQLDDFLSLMPDYEYCGVARNDGKYGGEFSPIFFLKDRFELLADSTIWLSEMPTVIGSYGWDAALPRILTWAKLKDKRSQKIFYFFNTHFDHRGNMAREKSAALIKQIIKNVAGSDPVVLTGDFNCSEKEPPYQILTKEEPSNGKLKDAFYLSEKSPAGPKYTFNGFGKASNPYRIDFIFVNPKWLVKKHSILDIKEGTVFISDHFPLLAEIQIVD